MLSEKFSDSPSPSEPTLPHYHKLPVPNYPQLVTPPSVMATSQRSALKLVKQVLFATFMLIFTLCFATGTAIIVMIFDDYDSSWSWDKKALPWAVCGIVALIDLALLCTTIRLFAKISIYSVPLVILFVVLWYKSLRWYDPKLDLTVLVD
ncbi:MAG: hypothetical protein M1840_005843 [Geoglossum simile]|nr:MAG: hypothetical protein M1840_005843 [Geoglossum simile]